MDTTNESASSRAPYFFVLQTGIITAAIALLGVYWLDANSDEWHVMGWYAEYIIPVGAILVGFAAGSGYGIASWFSGVKISRALLVAVLTLQAGAYIAAEYIEYRDVRKSWEEKGLVLASTHELPTFVEYYDLKARSFAWKPKSAGARSEPMGGAGYFFILLGAAGFVLSGLIAPALLFLVPYCDGCQRYMSTKVLTVLPASVPIKKASKCTVPEWEEYQKAQVQCGDSCDQALQRMRDAAGEVNVGVFKQEIAAAGSTKANRKLPRRVEIALIWCKACHEGHILPTVVTGSGKQEQKIKLKKIEVAPDFVRSVLQ